MRHVWIVEVRNPRDDYPRWEPTDTSSLTRSEARQDAYWWRFDTAGDPTQYRVRKYTPEAS